MNSEHIFNSEGVETIPLPKSIALPKSANSDLMLFLGAGASIPADIPGVEKMVYTFLTYLANKNYSKHLKIVQAIVSILHEWADKKNRKVDIELLLEAIERLENRDDDTLPLFYKYEKKIISQIDDLYLKTDKKLLLSDIVKRFIKSETGKVDIQVDYLNGLLELMEHHKPLDIFSTNYDVCIERFCNLNKKRYFDGFEEEWNPEKFKDQKKDKDILLYKLHGSVTWSRSEKGKYTRNEIAIKNTEDAQINIVTGEKEIPLILYPGKKLEYYEPVFDMFSGLRSRLNTVKYVFVIGYAFRDDHIRRLFKYAASKNSQLIIFLISPSAHQIYYSELRIHKDKDIRHSISPDSATSVSFNTAIYSDLNGRVICLPYRCQDVIGKLNHTYLKYLRKGQECENEIRLEEYDNKEKGNITRWDDCLSHYLECEHFEKIKELIDKKMDWNTLMKINYELGGKIIVRSFINSLLWEYGRNEWFRKYREYLPVFPEKMQVEMAVTDDLYLHFKHPSQNRLFSYDLFSFYQSLLDLYDKHLIFSNPNVSKTDDNHSLKINQILEYLEIWRENIPLKEYPAKRRDKYSKDMELIEQRINEYHENRSEDTKHILLQKITEVEVKELETKIS